MLMGLVEGGFLMPKKYYPSLFDQIHTVAKYLARYNSVILVTLAAASPGSVAEYEALRDSVFAFDALRSIVDPVLPDAPDI